ncbi:MAG: transglutaminase-like domain-containing protein [Deltaproteobacteria bacterium]
MFTNDESGVRGQGSGVRSFLFIVLLLLTLHSSLLAGVASAATTVLRGKIRVVYDLITDNPAVGIEAIPNYSNATFSQKVLSEDEFSKRVEVIVDISNPLASKTPFPLPASALSDELKKGLGPGKNIQVDDQEIRGAARDITAKAKTVAEAHSAVADWVRDQLIYDASKGVKQDASSVIRTKRGSCVGHTNLSIALLRAAGIPARYAHGYLPPGFGWGATEEFWGIKITRGGYHAWYETYFPDIGWAFSDGESSKNFVDPAHLVRYIDGIDINPKADKAGSLDFVNEEEGVGKLNAHVTFSVAAEEKDTRPIDQLPSPTSKPLFAVQTGPLQFGAVWGTVTGKGKKIDKGEVVLWKGTKGTVLPFENGEYYLVGLEGEREITVRAKGFKKIDRKISAVKGEISKIDIVLEPEEGNPDK